jgi:flagellar hook-length control protein FliK
MMETEDISFDQVLAEVETEDLAEIEPSTEASIEQNVQNVEDAVAEDSAEKSVKVQVEEQSDTTEKKEDVTKEGNVAEISETGEETTLSGNKDSGNDSLWNQNTEPNQVFVTGQSTTQMGQVNDLGQTQFNSYFSVDTMQIMEQIAEQIKIVVTPDTTSMEMQLNPENMGKIHLHISSEEGVVSAQFIATNDVVKEALETQMAVLRENLTQAGVKVDAIEVTIASHEFERNLEQNQKRQEEEIAQEEKQQRRRNITVDSLDELAGIMTEEETLVAQIMRDQGNSVDFTA